MKYREWNNDITLDYQWMTYRREDIASSTPLKIWQEILAVCDPQRADSLWVNFKEDSIELHLHVGSEELLQEDVEVSLADPEYVAKLAEAVNRNYIGYGKD